MERKAEYRLSVVVYDDGASQMMAWTPKNYRDMEDGERLTLMKRVWEMLSEEISLLEPRLEASA